MRIQPITNHNQNFKAVNQKYLAWAKEDIRLCSNVSVEWLHRLSYDVFLFKEMPHQDAIDTITAVKKIMTETDECLEGLLERLIMNKPNQ